MTSKELIKQILTEQRELIISKPFGIEREILKKIKQKLKLPHVIVITGIRRSGKSTLLRQIISKYFKDKDFYYINFEDERFFDFKANEFNTIYESLIELFGNKKVFLIDEIQNVKNFETFVRRFVDMGFKFIITGSNSKLLSSELSYKLTGRYINIVVKPFSFKEFLKLKSYDYKSTYTTQDRAQISKYFKEYLIKGGMPEFLIYNDAEIIYRVYEDIITKDIVIRHHIDSFTNLKQLYSYLLTNIGRLFTYNSLKKIVDFGSVNTIKAYLTYITETYLGQTINSYDFSLKKQIRNPKKFYVIDNAFINYISKRASEDIGWLLENLVFNNIFYDNLNKNIYFYKNGTNECDFLIKQGTKITEAIQVCYELNEDNKKRELKGLREAMKEFKLKKGLLLTYDQEDTIDNITIKPVWKWLLGTKRFTKHD